MRSTSRRVLVFLLLVLISETDFDDIKHRQQRCLCIITEFGTIISLQSWDYFELTSSIIFRFIKMLACRIANHLCSHTADVNFVPNYEAEIKKNIFLCFK